MEFGTNRQALEDSLRELAIGSHHGALVEACRSLASVVDALEDFDDKAWREYRLALGALMGATDGGSDERDEFMESLRASVGDAKDART